MLARVQSYLLQGIDALPCEVEIDLDHTAMFRRTIVGLPDAAVMESLERVDSAMGNTGYPIARGHLVINLAPADKRKEGPVYDLPIAIGLLATSGVIRPEPDGIDPRRFLFAGELALDGRVRPVKGVIALASLAKETGMQGVIVPHANEAEAAVVDGLEVYGVRTLAEVVGLVSGQIEREPAAGPDVSRLLQESQAEVDFADVRGQEAVKRAMVIAAAGGHNIVEL
jgi:magnesium chelatase family protein